MMFPIFSRTGSNAVDAARAMRVAAWRATGLLAVALLSACGGTHSPSENPAFAVSSSSLTQDAMAPAQYSANAGCTGSLAGVGADRSPQLSWRNLPAGTRSVAITIHDRDAATGSGFWHAVVADIPANVTDLPEGALAAGRYLSTPNDVGSMGYQGACPPPGQVHRYDITVHALKVETLAGAVPADASPALVNFIIAGNSLGSARLTALAGSGTVGGGAEEPQPPGFTVSSQDAVDGRFGNAQFAPAVAGLGCDGGNLSPQLSWSGAPAGTRSFAITMHDRDAPTGSGWWHWVLADVPASVQTLAANATPPAGSLAVRNDGGATGYGGICPPSGSTHHYDITVHALKVDSLGALLPPRPSPALVGFAIHNNSLGKASLTVLGGR